MKNWLKSKKKYFLLFFSSIIFHWLIMFLVFIIYAKVNNSADSFFHAFYKMYVQAGDTIHYLYIAEYWYPTVGENINLIVFFPLYPLLIKLLSFIIHDYFISGLIISNICMGISTCLLYYLAKLEFKDHEKAVESIYLLLLYPFSIFLICVFTESLFIMLSLLCLILIKKKKWLLVGLVGMLCSLTRIHGIIFLVPAAYQIITSIVKEKKFDWRYLYVLIIGLGFIFYLILNKSITGDYFSFLYYEKMAPWYNTSNWISANLAQQYGMALDYPNLSVIIYWVQIILYFLTVLLLFLGLKRNVSRYIIIYGVCFTIATYLQGWMISGPRHMMSCIPIYLIFPVIKNEYIKNTILALLGILTLFYTFCSLSGYAIM